MTVNHSAPDHKHHRNVANRPIFIDMPPSLDDLIQQFLVVIHVDRLGVPYSFLLVWHVNQDLVSKLYEPVYAGVTENFRKFRVGRVDHMLSYEISSRSVEAVSDKYRYVIHPCVPRCSTKKNPMISLGDFKKSANPGSTSNQPLFVEYEKSIFYVFVLLDVVPAINGKHAVKRSVLRLTDTYSCRLSFPVHAVALLGRCDDINISVPLLELVVGHSHSRFTRSDSTPKDTSVLELL